MLRRTLIVGFLIAAVLSIWPLPCEANTAKDILDASGVQGGLVVCIGCDDTAQLAALRATDAYLVQGLDTDAAKVAAASKALQSKGITGAVSVARFDGKQLPYVPNLVNLLVAEKPGDLSGAEIARVLAPGGVAMVGANVDAAGMKKSTAGKWTKLVKAVPEEIDEWTHYLHGPDNNAVANDTITGPPRHLQWLADPAWSRNHHKLASISCVVTGNGRLFYILDDGPAASMNVPPVWSLYARDAFSGVFLWKRPISIWASHTIGFRSGPVDLTRRLVVDGDQVFVTLGRGGPVSVLDAATGDTIRTLAKTEGAEEIIVHDGVALVQMRNTDAKVSLFDGRSTSATTVTTAAPKDKQGKGRQAKKAQAKKKPKKKKPTGKVTSQDIYAFDAETGKLLWRTHMEPASILSLTMAAAGDQVFFQGPTHLVALSLKDGKELWRAERAGSMGAGYFAPTLVVADGVVLSADNSGLEAFAADTGKPLWGCPSKATFHASVDVLVVRGVVWLGQTFTEGRDLHTGEVVQKNAASQSLRTVGHHHRCYRNKATDKYIIGGYRGLEFYDVTDEDLEGHSRNNWVRGTCQYGMMPANGMVYTPPHACGCYPESKLYGFYALAPGSADRKPPGKTRADLEKGPAFGKVTKTAAKPGDWATHRGNVTRSGSTKVKVPADIEPAWKTKIGGKLSAVTSAEGKVFLAAIDRHEVLCLDADSGKKLWSFTAGGRVDSPPTVHEGMALFGSRDGYAYCLRADDGELVWRFRAAPHDVRTVARDQIESVWPVHGTVLVLGDVAYVAAGRSSWIDGGIRLYGLNPATGEIVRRGEIVSEHPDLAETVAKKEATKDYPRRPGQNGSDWKTIAASDLSDAFTQQGGTISDILVSDGESIYMKQMRFDDKLVRQKTKGRHLYSTSGLLDDAENHRSHWMLGFFDMTNVPVAYSWIANAHRERFGGQFIVPYGLMLSFDDNTAWCAWRGANAKLCASPNKPFSPDEEPLCDLGKTPPGSEPRWKVDLPVRPQAILQAGGNIFLAGLNPSDTNENYAGKEGGSMVIVSDKDGSTTRQIKLDSPPVWDGMAATEGNLFMATRDGTLQCYRAK